MLVKTVLSDKQLGCTLYNFATKHHKIVQIWPNKFNASSRKIYIIITDACKYIKTKIA